MRTVFLPTRSARATANGVAPSANRCVISHCRPSTSRGRSIFAPRRLARSKPVYVRSEIFCASIFANELNTASRTFLTRSLSVFKWLAENEWNLTPAWSRRCRWRIVCTHPLTGEAVERPEQHEVEPAAAGVLEQSGKLPAAVCHPGVYGNLHCYRLQIPRKSI